MYLVRPSCSKVYQQINGSNHHLIIFQLGTHSRLLTVEFVEEFELIHRLATKLHTLANLPFLALWDSAFSLTTPTDWKPTIRPRAHWIWISTHGLHNIVIVVKLLKNSLANKTQEIKKLNKNQGML